MAQPEGGYIPPPSYCASYTDENVKNGQVRKPPRPPEGDYKMFGATYNVGDCLCVCLLCWLCPMGLQAGQSRFLRTRTCRSPEKHWPGYFL